MEKSPDAKLVVSELHAALKELRDISIKLECNPKAFDQSTTITVTARVYARPQVFDEIKPVIECPDVPTFGERKMKRKPSIEQPYADYRTTLRGTEFKPTKSYRIRLHLASGREPVASTTIHSFSKQMLSKAERRISEIAQGSTLNEQPRRSRRSRKRAGARNKHRP